MKLEKQVFNLEQCIDEAADVIAVKAHEKNLDLVVQIKVTRYLQIKTTKIFKECG